MAGVAGLSGLKPGQKHSGSFKPGYDPRRNSAPRYKDNKTLCELAREKTQVAFQTIIAVLEDPNASRKEKLIAADKVLDRGWGKALQGVLVAQESSNPGTMSTAELAAAAERLLAAPPDEEAIDAEFSEVRCDVDVANVEEMLLETADYGDSDVPV
ncbi:hypothetical protein FV139_00560 [Parahaliea maris]|uniref:DUF5681 domain-containing protein n=1 Tax=Parahaliea maris TaxID=2716870 RepID=A0A5C9A571_9GAMM|nr:hypothetical protein [Parahaliea maris]TXS96033.1 hypothetical protein FV139_00560 [Parahaliea maris]